MIVSPELPVAAVYATLGMAQGYLAGTLPEGSRKLFQAFYIAGGLVTTALEIGNLSGVIRADTEIGFTSGIALSVAALLTLKLSVAIREDLRFTKEQTAIQNFLQGDNN